MKTDRSDKLATGKVRYSQWMDSLIEITESEEGDDKQLDSAVRNALEALSEPERTLIERRFLMGQSHAQLSAALNRTEREIECALRETILKLRRILAPFVLTRFKIKSAGQNSCIICDSTQREEVEKIIASKHHKETWRRIIQDLNRILNQKAISPQLIIGHSKYHRKDHRQ